jgi:hypothetical protein
MAANDTYPCGDNRLGTSTHASATLWPAQAPKVAVVASLPMTASGAAAEYVAAPAEVLAAAPAPAIGPMPPYCRRSG